MLFGTLVGTGRFSCGSRAHKLVHIKRRREQKIMLRLLAFHGVEVVNKSQEGEM